MTKTIYIDSGIFISYFMKEKEKIRKIDDFFQKTLRSNTDFVASDWVLTEIVKVLIKNKNISPKKVAEYIQELERTKRIREIKLNWISVSKKKGYDFDEFFYEVQKVQLQYKGSLGDAIHAVIMKNNSINTILTTDSEFDGMKGMIVINPLTLNERNVNKNLELTRNSKKITSRQLEAFKLRQEHLNYAEIGKRMAISKTSAFKLVSKFMRNSEVTDSKNKRVN